MNRFVFFSLLCVFGFASFAAAQDRRVPPALPGQPHAIPDKNPAPPALRPPNTNGAPDVNGQGAKAKPKGPPGMMGLPWPQTPEEAEQTLGNLLAHLATTDDVWLARQVAVSIEKIWRLHGGETVNLLVDRATQATAKNKLKEALQLLDAASELQPDYAEIWNRRAYVYYRMGKNSAAVEDLRRALAIDPNHFRALDGMAKILADMGETKSALQAYEALIKVYPEIEGAKAVAKKLREEEQGKGI